MAAITTAILVGVAATASVASHFEQKKAARKSKRQQEKANRMSSVQAQVENATQRRRAIAQARIAQARNISGMGQATQSSSAVSGANAALSNQLGSNIGTANQAAASQQSIFDRRQAAQNAITKGNLRAGMFNAIGGVASFGASATAGSGGAATTSNAAAPPAPVDLGSTYSANFGFNK
jgi:hypothetical protein